ncbi:MAG: hypothetical protein U0871_29885 [Gemmataceae bacterium]
MWLPAGDNPARYDMRAYIAGLMTESGKMDFTKAPDTRPIRYSKMIASLSRGLLKIRRRPARHPG